MKRAYYNEHDPFAAQWLRKLIAAGHLPEGEVDERDIQQVRGEELEGFDEVHLFAGIGGWPLALKLAGWPAGRPVWTGSCPCQPFSLAGKQQGEADPRHLWPEMFRLIRERRPPTVFGEQVASAIGHGWLDGVFADLEAEGYACGAAVLGAHSVGAPHIRQRLFWVANADHERRDGRDALLRQGEGGRIAPDHPEASGGGRVGELADRFGEGLEGSGRERAREEFEAAERSGGPRPLANPDGEQAHAPDPPGLHAEPGRDGGVGGVGDASRGGCGISRHEALARDGRHAERAGGAGPWRNSILIPCRDGKSRRAPAEQPATESVFLSMVDGISALLGPVWNRLREEIKERMKTYADASEGNPDEAMRALPEAVRTAAIQWASGGRIGVPAAAVLFATMFKYEGELGSVQFCAPSRLARPSQGGLRIVRGDAEGLAPTSRSPHRREYAQQRAVEFEDLMRGLSQAIALAGGALAGVGACLSAGPLALSVPNRVGLLRAYGNAIVPQAAAEFVRVWMDVAEIEFEGVTA